MLELALELGLVKIELWVVVELLIELRAMLGAVLLAGFKIVPSGVACDAN